MQELADFKSHFYFEVGAKDVYGRRCQGTDQRIESHGIQAIVGAGLITDLARRSGDSLASQRIPPALSDKLSTMRSKSPASPN